MDKKHALAEAIEIANYYWPVKDIDNYFYRRWEAAEENLEKKLQNLLDR